MITKLLPVILPVVVKLLSEKSIPLPPDELILPSAILISPTVALVVTDKVPEDVNESAEIPLLASYTTALLATAVPAVAPSRRFISSLSAVTPDKILSSASVAVTVASLLIWSPVAEITVLPNVNALVTNPVVVVVPLTVTELLARVIKSASAPCPIVSDPTLILPTSSEPDFIESAPTSIDPKPSVIEPALSAPTSVIVLVSEAARNLASAAVLVYTSAFLWTSPIKVLILEVTPDNWLILVAETPVTPSKIFNSVSVAVTVVSLLICSAEAVTATAPNVSDEAVNSPFTVSGLDEVTSLAVNVITEAPSL